MITGKKKEFYCKCINDKFSSNNRDWKLNNFYRVEYFVKPEEYHSWIFVMDERNYSYKTFMNFNEFSNYFEIVSDLTEEQLKETRKNYTI